MSRSLIAPIALACTLLCGAQAHAANVSFSGFADGYQTVDISVSSPNTPLAETVLAGGFATSVNGGPSFTAYCIDLYQDISFGPTYTDYTLNPGSAHTFANPNALADIGKLYAEGNVIAGSVAQAAFQIAIWEIAYETSGSYNLSSGSVTISGGTAASSGALALASTWLGELSTTTNTGYGVFTLDSPTQQDQVFAAPVPEPETYALMLGGLGVIGFVARRRKAEAR